MWLGGLTLVIECPRVEPMFPSALKRAVFLPAQGAD